MIWLVGFLLLFSAITFLEGSDSEYVPLYSAILMAIIAGVMVHFVGRWFFDPKDF
jgi:hypothetical protein